MAEDAVFVMSERLSMRTRAAKRSLPEMVASNALRLFEV